MRPLCLFDFDGVIADSLDVFEKVLKESFVRLGHNFLKSHEDFLNLFRDNLYVSFSKLGISVKDVKESFDYIEKRVDFKQIKTFGNIKQMLKEISSITDMAIVSSNKETQIIQTLKGNKIDHFFKKIFGFESGLSKVEKLKAAMKNFGVSPENTYYVVDTTGDLKEALAANVQPIAVGWGWHRPEELKEFKPNYFVANLEDLGDLLRSLCKR